jgi:succinate dehydrogenase/fumarate reductase flavoprotein subunit
MANDSLETDVLVIGGGGAGFRAAIAAREKGAEVLLLSKGPLARSGASPMAGADFTMDGNSLSKLGLKGDPNDSMEKVFNDIVTQGFYLNNQKMIDHYVHRAPALLKDMLDWGLDYYYSDQRAIFTSGIHIMDVLLKKARSAGVKTLEDVMLLDLTVEDRTVNGALALDIKAGKFIHLKAKSVVMATGGWHKAFWPNTGMRDLSGDGVAAANRAGASLGNMEFITFCCNVFYDPPIWRGSIAPYVLSLLCGGQLTNSRGEDILKPFDDYMVKIGTTTEWNKTFLSYLSAKESREGRCFEHGGIHYRRGDVPMSTINMFAGMMFPNWKYKALDLTEWGKMLENNEPAEVGPAVEYFEGGILVTPQFETDIQGLFAAGECTTGLFGANRVFSAITEMLVQGLDAGQNAAAYAEKNKGRHENTSQLMDFQKKTEVHFGNKTGTKPAQIRREVQEKAHKYLGPIRNARELTDFIEYLESIKKNEIGNLHISSNSRAYNKEWIDALELPGIIHLLEAAARCALARNESRGTHFREDFPMTDNDRWLKESVVSLSGGKLQTATRDVTVLSTTLPTGSMPYLEMMKKLMKAHSDTGGHH